MGVLCYTIGPPAIIMSFVTVIVEQKTKHGIHLLPQFYGLRKINLERENDAAVKRSGDRKKWNATRPDRKS